MDENYWMFFETLATAGLCYFSLFYYYFSQRKSLKFLKIENCNNKFSNNGNNIVYQITLYENINFLLYTTIDKHLLKNFLFFLIEYMWFSSSLFVILKGKYLFINFVLTLMTEISFTVYNFIFNVFPTYLPWKTML